MPFNFSLSFKDSLIKKIEIYYEGASKLNVLTIYTIDVESTAMIANLLTGLNSKISIHGWTKGKLALSEIVGVIRSNNPEHAKLHPAGDKNWLAHHHIKFTNLTPEILFNFISRIAAIQDHPTIRINFYHKMHGSPFSYIQSFFSSNSPKHLISEPLLTEKEQYMLFNEYSESYSKETVKWSLLFSPNRVDFLDETPTQLQCLRIAGTSNLRELVGLAAIQLNQEAFTNNLVQAIILLFMALLVSKIISRLFKSANARTNRETNKHSVIPSYT